MVMTPEATQTRSPHGDGARFVFRRRHRLSGLRAYSAVYREGIRKGRGPLLVVGRPNGLDDSRLGLSVPRRVGTAVRRNLIKRRVREAFRLIRPSMPAGYDLVVNVRPHEPLTLEQYTELLSSAWRAIDAASRRRRCADDDPS